MLQPMKKIQVIGPKKDLANVVDVLYHTGTVHLEDVSRSISPGDTLLRRMVVDKATDVSGLLAKIGGIFLALPKIQEDKKRQDTISKELRGLSYEGLIEKTNQVITELETTTKNLAVKKSDLEFTLAALNKYEKIIDKIQPLESQLPVLEGFEVTVLLIQREFRDVLELIRSTLVEITKNQFELISAEIDETTIAAVTIFNKRYSEPVHSFIFSQNVNEVRLPPEYLGKPFQEILTLIDEKKRKGMEEIKEINIQFSHLSANWYQELAVLRRVLEDRNEEISAISKFGQTDYTFMIVGWVPRKFLQRTNAALTEGFEKRVIVTELEVSPEEFEGAPTFYDNPWFVKPFEFLMQLISPPKYREIDPSPVMALFFPIFFGIMVGDIAYGIAILVIAVVLKKRYQKELWLQHLMDILIICSFPSIFFGFLYGEFLGNFGEMMGWIHPVTLMGVTWNRVEAIIPLLMLAVAVGVIHVFTGLVLGILNAITERSKKHVCEKCGMIVVISGFLLLIGAIAGMVPEVLLNVGVVMVLIAIPLIIYGGGFFGAFEIMGTVGNILSYARIMAIGMASVILALVANKLGGSMEIVLVGILIAALLHILNIALAMFSPFLHSLRLHLVEFNQKFYTGGGTLYAPFKKEKGE